MIVLSVDVAPGKLKLYISSEFVLKILRDGRLKEPVVMSLTQEGGVDVTLNSQMSGAVKSL